jgi:transglutaminase-like putative cysteine protease
VVSVARPVQAAPRARWSPWRALRRLHPAEGWSAVLLLAIVLLSTAWTVARTDIAPDGPSMAALAIGGLLTGLVLAKLGVQDILAHLFAIVSGVFGSLLLAIERMPLVDGGRMARANALAELALQWFAQAQSGQPLNDPRLLAIMLGAAVWLVAYTSAWVLFRRGWLTTALALPVVIAMANLGYAPEEGTLPLLVMVVAGTLLAARHAAFRRQMEWARLRLPYPRRTISRFLLGGAMIAIFVGVLAWTLPLSARDNLLGEAWTRVSEPLEELSDRWNELLARFGGSAENGGGSYSAFGESFRLGGHLELSDDPVLLLQPQGGPMRPVYLAGQRYDDYDGHGWTTTVDQTFQDVGPDGKRYSSRLSYRTGQGVQLSPEVTTDRSQVVGAMQVIRPKGDLLFTVDTYLTANRRTNVQLSWQQFDNQAFPLPADPEALPLDLRRIAVLLSRGTFSPASDGSSTSVSPLPQDPALATDVQSEREALKARFLDVSWDVGPDGKAHTLRVTGQAPVYDDVEAVFSQGPVAEGESYAVTGLESMASPEQLRSAGTEYPAWVTARYLELPGTVTDRTRQLADQLASGQSSAFDTALAVEEYVRSTIAYNEDIKPPPSDRDVVDYVLFDSKQGYCEYYASAMAVLLRAEGIPTRVVGGYFPAPFDPAAGGHLYREKNAHLWVEVFFPKFGWIPFEPTANRDPLDYGNISPPDQAAATPTPEPTPQPQVAEPTPVPPAAEPPSQEPPPLNPQQLLSDPARIAGWVGIALAALLLVGALAATSAWFAGFRGLSPISSLYARALRAGKWLGVSPAPSLTPREYADRVGRFVPSARGPARVVADLYTQERYAGRRPSSEQTQTAQAAWRHLRGIALGSRLPWNRGGRRV